MSPILLFIVMTTGLSLGGLEAAGLLILIGMVMAGLMFFAWLTPTPDSVYEAETEPADDLLGAAS